MSLEKPNAGKLVQLSEGFIIKQFQNTIWVPEMAHPTENSLGSSTSQSETNISPNLPHEISQRQPLGSASASLAQRQPLEPMRLPRWPSSGSVQLLAASVWPPTASAWPLAGSACTLSWLLRC